MKLRPLYNRLVVKRTETPSVSPTGIILGMNMLEKKPEGTVMAIGHDVSLGPGDRVLFKTTAGTEVKVDGDTLLVMTEDDVIAVIT